MSTHRVDNIQEITPGAGVTITGLKAPGFKTAQSAFMTTAERDAFFAGILAGNELASNNQTGYVERFDAPSGEWRPEGVTGTAGPLIRTRSKGAKGTGGVNDRQAILDTDTAVAAFGGIAQHDPGTYRIDAALALVGAQHFVPGAKLRPALGVNVDVQGPFGDAPDGVFDTSLGGTFSFWNNTNIKEFKPQWWGILGKGAPESALMAKMISMLPDGAEVRFSMNMNVRLDQTPGFNIPGRTGIKFIGTGDPRIGDFTYSTFTYTGPAGGTMCFLDTDMFCHVRGFKMVPGNCDIVFELDKLNYGHIGTNCVVEQNLILNNGRPNFHGVRISETVFSNHEYHEIRNNVLRGYGLKWRFNNEVSGSSAVNPTFLSSVSAIFVNNTIALGGMIGARVYIEGAGAAGARLETTIASVTDTHNIVLADPILTTITNKSIAISTTQGVGIRCWGSSNTHAIQLIHNDISNYKHCIEWSGGSFQASANQTFESDVNWYIGGNSLPCHIDGDNCENSFQHFRVLALNAPIIVRNIRLGLGMAMPGALIQNDSFRPMLFEAVTLENTLPPGSTVFGVAQDFYPGVFAVDGLVSTGGITRAQMGLSWKSHSIANTNIAGDVAGPASHNLNGGVYSGRADDTAIRGEAYIMDAPGYIAGVIGATNDLSWSDAAKLLISKPPRLSWPGFPARSARGALGGHWMVGVQGTTLTRDESIVTKNIAVHARMPVMQVTGGAANAIGVLVTAPETIPDGSAFASPKGIVVEEIWHTTQTTGETHAFLAEGARDFVQHAGPTRLNGKVVGGGIAVSAGAAGVLAVDIGNRSEWRITATGDVTPSPTATIPFEDGQQLRLVITNSTAGAIVVTLSAAFKGIFTAPAPGLTGSRLYSYSVAAGAFIPIGGQSADF